MIVTVQKKVLEQAILDLERLEQYYTDKVNDFMSSRFSNGKSIGVKFTNYLKQIRAIYTDIASNIKNTKEYLKNYLDDILALESEMSNTASSYISVPSVSSIVLRYRNMLEKTPLLGSQLFLNVDIVSFSESKLFQNTQVDLSKHHITSKEAEELVLGADLRNDFSDSDIAFLKDYFSNMYQSTIQQDTMNLSLKEAEYKKVQETQEKLSQLGYTFLSLETALQNATSKAEKEKLQKIMDSTGFSSSKSFQEYAKKVELEFQTLSSKLHMEEQTLKTLSYSLGMKASDYQNFKESSNIKKEDLASLIDRDNHIIDYKEYCKKYGEVDPYTFKKTINENFSNVAITGMKDSKTLKYLEEIESVDPEIARYYRYLYQKFGEDEAHQYLKDMEETIHMRTGELQAKKFLESLTDLNDEETRIAAVKNHLSVTGKGLSSGVVGFGENLMYALEGLTIPVIEAEFDIGDYHFSNKDFIKEHENRVYSPNEYETMYILQAFLKDEDKLQTGLLTQDATGKLISTSDLIDYTADYGKLLDHNYQISSSIGNMLPSVVASALVPGGQVLFGVSAAGGSYHSAMVEGESHGKSLLYGTVSGASELLTEKLLGGIPFLSDVQAINFKTLLQASGKEGVEEFVQSYLDAGTQKLIFNKNSNMGELFGEAVQSAAYGAITGGIMNVPQFAINRFNINTIDKQLQSGKISKGEFLEAMHNLIPETENMSYEEIKKEYLKPGKETTLTLTKNEGKMFSKNGFSSLMSGIGMFGTGAFSLASKSQSKNNSDVSTQESHSSVSANQNASINPTSNVISKGDTSSVKIHAENDIELKAGVNQESFERVNLDEVNKLSSFKNVQTVTEALDVISESVDLQKSLDTISKKVLPKAILGMINFPSELLAKFKYDKLNSEISQKVANEGIYHITSLESVNKILESGYVKASNVISSYGAKKSFFFAGLPNVGDVACNFPEFLQKCVAVKLNVPESDLSDFRYRSLGDHAVTHKGDYHFDSSNGSLAYLGMFEENGKLVYKEISKSEYENFHSNIGKGKINSLKTNLQSLMLGFATEYENSLRNLEQIKNTFANTNMNETLANLSHKAKSLLNEKVDIKNVIDVNSQMYQNAVAINKYLKKGINGITRVGKCSAGVGLLLPFAIHPFLGLATLGKATSLFTDGFYGNVIKNSFLINAEGRKIDTKDGTKKVSFLYQNPMAFGDFIKSRFTNGKTEFFTARSINALQYLEANKSYGTVSQPFTLYLLKKAQKLGFIENLTYQKSKVESNLILERLLLGVEKRDKKIQMFDIAFDTTGKKLTQSDIETLTKGVNLSEYKTKTDKKGRIIFDLDLSFQDYLKNSPEVLKKFVFDLYDVMKAIPKNTGTKIKEKFANSSLLNQVYGNMDVSCAALNASVSSLFQRIYDSALNIRESLKSKFSSLDSATYQMVEDSLADIPYSQNKRFFLENISSILRCDLKNASKMFQDAKQYLISMIPDLCIRQKGNMDFYEDCMSFFDTDFTRRVNEMSYDSVYQKFSKYLTKKEKSLLKDMVLNEPYMGELEQQAISFYTKIIGPVLTSYLRGVDTNFSDGKNIQTYHGGDIHWVRESFQKCFQRWVDTSNAKTKEFFQNNSLAFDYQDPDFMVEMMDSVIERSEPLKQNIVVYRTVDGIYKDGDKITTYDIGTRFTDKAYQSTSLTKGLFANINPNRIVLKIEVPEGTKGAYLEKFTGITHYGQQEFLLDRNATMEITGDFYYDENQMLVLPVRVLSTEMSKMGIDKALPNSSLDYFQVANISEEGQISLSDVVSSLKEKGLISVFEEEVRFLKKHQVYDSSIPEHGLDHVKNVLLSSLYMGQEMHLSRREQLILTKAASLHDCGIKNNHKNHGLESANLIDRYVPEFSSQDKNLLKAVIEYHEMPDNGPNLYNIHHKYALTSKEDMQSFQKISNILKDADAIDRVRFPNNLNSSLLRLDLSKNLLKAEYQLQEIRAKNILNQNLKSYHFETRQAIEYLQSQNIPSYLIYMYVENPWYTGTYRYFTPEIKEKLESIRILGSQDILSKVESYKNLVLSNHAIYDWLENHDLDDALDLSISQEKLQEAIRLKRNITESFQYMNEKYQFLLKENPNLYNWLENSNLDSTLDLFIDKKLLEEGRLLKEEIQKVQEQLDFQYRFSIDEMITEVRNYQKIIQENPNLENWLKNHDLDDTVDFTIDPDVLEKAYALKKNIDEQFKLREIEYQTTLDLSQKQSLKSELDTLRKEMGFMNTLDIKKVLGNIKDLPVEAQNYIHELSIDSDYLALKGFVDTLIHGYQTGDEDVKTIVENIDALKLTGNSLSFNDNLKFGTSKFMDENSLPDGSFLKDAHMYIDNEVGNGFQVMSHEMGHMLWDTLNNKSLPDNYSHVMDKIREKWRQDPSKLESFLTEAREYKEKLWSQMKSDADSYFELHKEDVANQIEEIFQDENQLYDEMTKASKMYGISLDEMNQMIDSKDRNRMVDLLKRYLKTNYIHDNFYYICDNDSSMQIYDTVAGIIDSIYNGENPYFATIYDNGFLRSHTSEYFSSYDTRSFDEQFADFTRMKFYDMQAVKLIVNELCGPEWFDMMNDKFHEIAVQMKEKDSWYTASGLTNKNADVSVRKIETLDISEANHSINSVKLKNEPISHFQNLSLEGQTQYIKRATYLELDSLLKDLSQLSDNNIKDIEDRIILCNNEFYFDMSGYRLNAPSLYHFISNNQTIIQNLSNNSLIALSNSISDHSLILDEIIRRIEKGDAVYDKMLFDFVPSFFQDSENSLFQLSEEMRDKVMEIVRNNCKSLPENLREVVRNKGLDFFTQGFIGKAYVDGKIDDEGIQFVKKLVDENPHYVSFINYNLLNKNYLNAFSEKFMKHIISKSEISFKIEYLHNNYNNLFQVFSKLVSNFEKDDSLFTFYPKTKAILDFMYENCSNLKDCSFDLLSSDVFINYCIYQESGYKNSVQNHNLSFDYFHEFDQLCDRKYQFYEGDIDEKKNLFYEKYFSLNELEVQDLIKKYQSGLDDIRSIDSLAVDMVESMKFVTNIQDESVLDNLYHIQEFRFTPEEVLNLDDRLRHAYSLTYVNDLQKTQKDIQSYIKNHSENVKKVAYGNKIVDVILYDGDFSFLVKSTATGLASSTQQIKSFQEQWKHSPNPNSHIVSTSKITNSNMGTAPILENGVLYGFTNVSEKNIVMVSTTDMHSNIHDYGYSALQNQNFVTSQKMSENSLRVYSEVALEKSGVKPDFIIVFEDSSKVMIDSSIHAAAEWGIPIIQLNRLNIATKESNKINNYMKLFETKGDLKALSQALNLFESNTSGYHMNYLDNLKDGVLTPKDTPDIIKDRNLFDSNMISKSILNYIHQLQGSSNELTQLETMIQDIQSRYEANADLAGFQIAETKSLLPYETIIEAILKARSKYNE